jgi:hypothetical protein
MAYELAYLKNQYTILRAELAQVHKVVDNTAKNVAGLVYLVTALIEGVEHAKQIPNPFPTYSATSSTLSSIEKLKLIESVIIKLASSSMEALVSAEPAPEDYGTADWDPTTLRVSFEMGNMADILADL